MPDDKPTTESTATEPPSQAASPKTEGLTDYWDDILGPRPETIERRLVRELGLPHPGRFSLATSNGRLIVAIDPDGKIHFGEGITPDAAAEEFWTSMSLKRTGMEQRLQHLAIMEAMLVRLGRAEITHERAHLASEREGATDHERMIAERTHDGLQALVHQILEYSRGLAQRHAALAPEAAAPVDQGPRETSNSHEPTR